ncbi:nitrite reductase small subunit NirD [Umezawaea sp. Da 62-37]|uniref:nitrite reductase small subunit NirD n=1 Tax=Umezawaea sp. Da 62-37 TaxID=3075927 RepID=UPI0028F6E5A2|nr:nitrite reductase small subunit NirD [Umezawaea sp. Da 62-37]WNV82488.1 nitrite reductase small subunit NirD [Umezawaea sp. Da 62-37]
MTAVVELTWTSVCALSALQPEAGVAVLLPDASQVALFRTFDGALHAVDNIDPFSGAAVLSRGIVGDRGGVPVVASPIYKQAFDLATGACLDDPAVSIAVHQVRVLDDIVQVRCP